MRRNRLWKVGMLAGAILAMMAVIGFWWQPATAESTITVYKSPT